MLLLFVDFFKPICYDKNRISVFITQKSKGDRL